MRWISPGTFLRGSPETELGRWPDEGPQHEVILTRGYWLGETPVTQTLWALVMGENPRAAERRAPPWSGTRRARASSRAERRRRTGRKASLVNRICGRIAAGVSGQADDRARLIPTHSPDAGAHSEREDLLFIVKNEGMATGMVRTAEFQLSTRRRSKARHS
jgi:hypothetical protein